VAFGGAVPADMHKHFGGECLKGEHMPLNMTISLFEFHHGFTTISLSLKL
jgi:hypothetical protein